MPTAVPERLQKIRERKDLALRPTKHLREKFVWYGEERPLRIRYYQVQGILHLVAMKRFLLGDDTGLGKCASYDTYVNTDLGLVQLGEIADWSGMEPDTFRPMDREVNVLIGGRQSPIKNFYYGGSKPTIRVMTRYGFRNTMSLVHPMRVLRGDGLQWVQARELKEGDHLCVERREEPFPAKEPELTPSGPLGNMTPDLARFLGYYIGLGDLTAKRQIRLSLSPAKDTETHADMLRLFQGLFGKLPNYLEGGDLCLDDTNLREWLAENGLGHTLSASCVVPECILQATRESSAEFLRALFEGKGHAGKASIEYSTASEELGRQVQIMLLRFGVVSKRAPKKVKGRGHTYWKLTIGGPDALTFQERLGFLSTRKNKSLASFLDRPRNTNHDVVPGIRGVFEQVRKDLFQANSRTGSNSKGVRSGLKHLDVSLVNTLNNIRDYGGDLSYTFIEKVVGLLEERNPGAESLPILKGFLETRYFYDPIVSLESGEEDVFDIEVDDPYHSFVGNGFVNHNTLQAIAALCYLWEPNPDLKAIVLTTKSATPQWAAEFEKFTTGVNVIVCAGTAKKRERARAAFQASTGPTVMIYGYGSIRRDISEIQDWKGYALIADEITAVKNPKTQVHQVVKHMGFQADRVWGLTATMIKNHLMEGYGIFQVIKPDLFPMTTNRFMLYYCLTRMQRLPRSNRQIPVIVGYLPEKIQEFKEEIAPYFLGRPKHEVASDLPALVTKTITVGMSGAQQDKYDEALSGLLEMGQGEDALLKETDKLTQIIYCQEIVNHLDLIDCEGPSEKLDALITLLTEGDFEEENVIVFTRFSKMVDILMPALRKAKVDAVRITGAEKMSERKAAMDAFQDPNEATRVVCITMAAGDAINLQAAKAIVFFDTPWSAGDFIQIVGRMIRIGSAHDRCYAIHLVARGKKATVDSRVLEVMHKKMKLIEAVIGRRLKGEKDIGAMIPVENDISNLFDMLTTDARES